MQKVPYTNDTDRFQHIGGVSIPPGETRHVEASLVPGAAPADEEQELEKIDMLVEFMKVSASLIIQGLATMPAEDLARASDLEAAGKARKTVLEAIAAEQLRRAHETAGGAGGAGAPDGAGTGADTDSNSDKKEGE